MILPRTEQGRQQPVLFCSSLLGIKAVPGTTKILGKCVGGPGSSSPLPVWHPGTHRKLTSVPQALWLVVPRRTSHKW